MPMLTQCTARFWFVAAATAFSAPFLVSSAAAVEAGEAAAETEFSLPLLTTEDACEQADAETEQCGLHLRQLRGERTQGRLARDPGEDGPVHTTSHTERALGPTGSKRGKELTGRGSSYHPVDQKLLEKSTAPLHKFYVYRATSQEIHDPLNTNMANLAGVMWYLNHEVVIQYPRKYYIQKIARFTVQVRAPQPLYDRGMNFGVRLAFDLGQATGPFVCGNHSNNISDPEVNWTKEPEFCALNPDTEVKGDNKAFEWSKYGYFVGCNKLGDFPYPDFPVYYPGATWFSFPGSCPSKVFDDKTEKPDRLAGKKTDRKLSAKLSPCETSEPGGYCPGVPTGTGDCTWTYTYSGHISINEMLGIGEDEWRDFNNDGRREYNPDTDNGTLFSWWDGINDTEANKKRMEVASAFFKKKFPNDPTDEEMPHPPCDFEIPKFYREYMGDPIPHTTTTTTTEPPPTTTTEPPAEPDCGDESSVPSCAGAIGWVLTDGRHQHPDWFSDLPHHPSRKDVQKLLHDRKDKANCPLPCSGPSPPKLSPPPPPPGQCADEASVPTCAGAISWVLKDGRRQHPDWFSALPHHPTRADVQKLLHDKKDKANCPLPCGGFHSGPPPPPSPPKHSPQHGHCGDETSVPSCPGGINWVIHHGMKEHPSWFKSLPHHPSRKAVQQLLFDRHDKAKCPRPC